MPLKIVTAMDSFKGTMSSIEACERVKNGIQDVIPDAEVVCIPVAERARLRPSIMSLAGSLSGRR